MGIHAGLDQEIIPPTNHPLHLTILAGYRLNIPHADTIPPPDFCTQQDVVRPLNDICHQFASIERSYTESGANRNRLAFSYSYRMRGQLRTKAIQERLSLSIRKHATALNR